MQVAIDPTTSSSPCSKACDDTGYVPTAYPLALIINGILCPAGHRIESTVKYLGIEIDDAIEIAEKIDF